MTADTERAGFRRAVCPKHLPSGVDSPQSTPCMLGRAGLLSGMAWEGEMSPGA